VVAAAVLALTVVTPAVVALTVVVLTVVAPAVVALAAPWGVDRARPTAMRPSRVRCRSAAPHR
jgi:hypothetical protein